MIKLFATDLDGTLLFDGNGSHHNTNLSETRIDLINQLKQKGIHFAIATGRDYFTRHKISDQIGFPIDAIGSNGCCVVVNEKLMVNHTLSWDIMFKLNEELIKLGYPFELLTIDSEGRHAMTNPQSHVFFVFNHMKANGEIRSFTEVPLLEWAKRSDFEPNKIVIVVEEHRDEIMEKLLPFIDEYKVDMFYSGPIYVEIMPRNINKASGIEVLMRYYNIKENEVAVIGDSMNDAAMLSRFKNSYVMSHASSDVLKLGKKVV
ncbi:MAG: HAD family hydrolase, partial [Erysipelotrichaceae bacterium]|nr:HAD family hydrolase [Erysipelotrichaceae bacterium]